MTGFPGCSSVYWDAPSPTKRIQSLMEQRQRDRHSQRQSSESKAALAERVRKQAEQRGIAVGTLVTDGVISGVVGLIDERGVNLRGHRNRRGRIYYSPAALTQVL